MLLIFLCNQVFIHIKSICVASLFHAFQRNADYRILSLIRHIFRISCDFQAVKKISVAFLSCLKKSLQHTHVECFAESSWSGEKIDGFFVFQELLYHQRFIDKVVPVVHQPLEILYANRQGFVFHVSHLCLFLQFYRASCYCYYIMFLRKKQLDLWLCKCQAKVGSIFPILFL